MNKYCCFVLFIFLLLANEILFFIIDILILSLSTWITKAIKIIFCIYFSFSCLRFLHFCALFALNCNIKCAKLLDKMITIYGILYFVFMLFWIVVIVIITINFVKYKTFWDNCPYIIKNLEYNLHVKKRCELFNINNNSRYAFQYICSYDSSKDFKNTINSEIEEDNVICLEYNHLINNDIINEFINEYKDEQKYICSRTNIPKYEYANDKDCSEKKRKYMYAFLILVYLRFLILFSPIFSTCFYDENMRRNNLYFGDFLDISRKSTNVSEKSNRDEIFVKQNTQNIIIENKEIFIINTNIKNVELKKIRNNIGLNKDEKSIYIQKADTFNINSNKNSQNINNNYMFFQLFN